MRRIRNPLYLQGYRGFESPPLYSTDSRFPLDSVYLASELQAKLESWQSGRLRRS